MSPISKVVGTWYKKHAGKDEGGDDEYDYAPAACVEGNGDDDDDGGDYDYAPAASLEGDDDDDDDDGSYDYAPAA